MTTQTNDLRTEAFNLLDRALLRIRSEANELLGVSGTLSVEQQRIVWRIYMIADAVHNLPHQLSAEQLPDESFLIQQVNLAKETLFGAQN